MGTALQAMRQTLMKTAYGYLKDENTTLLILTDSMFNDENDTNTFSDDDLITTEVRKIQRKVQYKIDSTTIYLNCSQIDLTSPFFALVNVNVCMYAYVRMYVYTHTYIYICASVRVLFVLFFRSPNRSQLELAKVLTSRHLVC